MPRKPSSKRPSGSPKQGARRASGEEAPLKAELERALDGLLEEGIENYDDKSESGRRRMMELHAGFAAGESLLARLREPRGPRPERPVEALCSVIRYILHWAGEARTLDEPEETVVAMRRARRALERAAGAERAGDRSRRRRRGGAA